MPTRNTVAQHAALALVSLFYIWTAVPLPPLGGEDRAVWERSICKRGKYNMLADALLAGQTALLVEPSPELKALPDPYDPLQNHPPTGAVCIHDVSYYKEKYYLYFGVVPAVVLYAPFKFVTGCDLPEPMGALILALLALAWGGRLLTVLVDRFYPQTGPVTRFALVAALGLSNYYPYLLRSPLVYEVAILAGQATLLGGLYYMARGSLGERVKPLSLAVGSLLLGMAVGCRPHLGAVGMLVFVALGWWWLRGVRERGVRASAGLAAAILGPWMLVLALLGWYNYDRFGSPLEFGTKYNLISGSINLTKVKLLNTNRLLFDLKAYLFQRPVLQPAFPYVDLRFPSDPVMPEGNFGFAPVAGVMITLPALWLACLAPLVGASAWRKGQRELPVVLAILIGGGVGLLLTLSLFGCCMRYVVDFVGLLLVASLLVFAGLVHRLPDRPALRWGLCAVMAFAAVPGCTFNALLSVLGQRGLPCDRAVHARLAPYFPELTFVGQPVRIQLEAEFPEGKTGGGEPIVVSGITGEGDFVYVLYQPDGSVVFAFNHWGRSEVPRGRPVSVVPGRTYQIEVEITASESLPQMSNIVVRLDGEEVLRACEPIHPLERKTVRIGENRIGGGLTTERFSGSARVRQVRLTRANWLWVE
jgi:hypothetical protein